MTSPSPQPEKFRGATSVSITVKDIHKSTVWYRDVVGFGVERALEREGHLVLVWLKAGDVRLSLNQDDGDKGWDRINGLGFDQYLDHRGRRRHRQSDQGQRRHSRLRASRRTLGSTLLPTHGPGRVQAGRVEIADLRLSRWCALGACPRARGLAEGPMRFNALLRLIGGVSHRMLTLTLRGLEHDGLANGAAAPILHT
jgi:hypothetical protein